MKARGWLQRQGDRRSPRDRWQTRGTLCHGLNGANSIERLAQIHQAEKAG